MSKTTDKIRKTKKNQTEQLTEAAIKGIQEKKGHEIVLLDLRKTTNPVADLFIICHGTSTTQVEAIADSVEEMVYKKTKETPYHKEGRTHANWIILDFVNVVVHIFIEDKRFFYGLEKLWADAEHKIVVNG